MSQHARALTVLRDLAEGAQPWGLPVFVRRIDTERLMDEVRDEFGT